MIRQLKPSDSLNFQHFKLLSLKTDPKAFLSDYTLESNYPQSYFEQKIIQATKPPIFGIYGYFTVNNSLAAIAQLSPEYHYKMKHLANVYDVYVHPDHRGQGLAKKLLSHLISQAETFPALEQIHLRCNSDNLRAASLYKSLGFSQIAVRKDAVKEKDGTYQNELLFSLKIARV